MKQERVKIDQFNKDEYQYAWIQEYDKVILSEASKVYLDMDNLIEARFFNESKEFHIFNQDALVCVETEMEDSDQYFEEKQLLRKKFGKNITIRHYFGFDIGSDNVKVDGQAYIKYSALCNCTL